MNISQTFSGQIDTLTLKPKKKEAFKKLVFKEDVPVFQVKDGKVYFLDVPGVGFNEKSNDALVNKIKLLIKKNPLLFFIAYRLIGSSFVGKDPLTSMQHAPAHGAIVNLGSGVTALRDDIINIDFYPFLNVDVVASIGDLPFADNSVAGIISETVLEHVPNPTQVIHEMHRILMPGGLVYVVVPFVFSFHSSPYDFHRWSKMGLQEDFREFEMIECGVRSGAGAALDYIVSEYLATLLSFGSKTLHQIWFMLFLVILTPLCYLDYLTYKLPTTENSAATFYYIGKKKGA